MNIIIQKDNAKHQLAEYFHKCALSPAISTFQRAIRKGHFITWPGIENINFEKTITNLLPTAKGHLDQERANLQTTKSTQATEDKDFVPADGIAIKTYENSAKIYHTKPK